MKKTLYFAAAAIALVACSKTEIVPQTDGTNDITVSVAVDNGSATKAVYDGDKHIKFEKGDGFYGAVAKTSTPNTAVMVAKQSGATASVYYSKFSIVDAAAESPEFKGSLYSIPDADFEDEYILYGLFPTSAVNPYDIADCDNMVWTVTLPSAQKPTQTYWESKADVMVLQPTVISTADKTHDDQYGEYSTTQNEKLKFAHVFGFGKFTFAGVPAEYENLVVKSIRIETADAAQKISGSFDIDIKKHVDEIVPKANYSSYNYISLTGDGKTTVKDYVAWIVANPGKYDVTITVETSKAALVFERTGLNIVRGNIAAPVVNYKSSDTINSHDVTLAEGETWAHTFTSSNCITSANQEKSWGPAGKTMAFSLSYPGSTNSNYGYYLRGGDYSTGYVYAQKLASSNIIGGKVLLTSAAAFSGASLVKVNLGIYTKDVTADFTVSLVDGADSTAIGHVSVSGSNADINGTDFYFESPDGKKGQLVICVDNFSNTNCAPYLKTLAINPVPDIVLEDTSVKVSTDAGTGKLSCKVYAASGDPTVTVSDDAAEWLSAKYDSESESVIYTVAANTGAKRTGTISVKAQNTAGETVSALKVTQNSATAKEYTLTVTAADVYPAIQAKIEELTAAGTTIGSYDGYPVDVTVKAKAADGSEKDVTFSAEKIVLKSATESQFTMKKSFTSSSLGEITKIVVEANSKLEGTNYNDTFELRLSEDNSSWTKAKTADGVSIVSASRESTGYTTTVTNIPDTYTQMKFYSDYSAPIVYSFEITFVAD